MPSFSLCRLVFVLTATFGITALRAADVSPAVSPSPEERYEQIDQEYQNNLSAYRKSGEQPKTDEERRKVITDFSANCDRCMARCMALAREFPHTTGAIKALILILHNFRNDAITHETLDLVRAEYLNREELAKPCIWYGNYKLIAAAPLLRDLAAKSPHRSVRGAAALSLARRAASEGSPDAEKLLEQVAAEYGDVRVWDDPLKMTADGELLRLRSLVVGKTAPEIEGVDMDGVAMKLSDYRGKVVLLDFWGYWCGGCVGMIPYERSLVQRLRDRPFALLGVNDDDAVTYGKGAVREPTTWRNWRDGHGGPISTRWAVAGYPEIYVLDAKGVIRFHEAMDEKQIDLEIDALLKETESVDSVPVRGQ